MIKNKSSGVIVNVSSGAGKSGFPNLSAYCANKFGVIGLTESVAKEVTDNNVKNMAICPGAADLCYCRYKGISKLFSMFQIGGS
jgi:NAD(P)-dependent dehydrogenase (short-subunit alcohol dehydrogenase family)